MKIRMRRSTMMDLVVRMSLPKPGTESTQRLSSTFPPRLNVFVLITTIMNLLTRLTSSDLSNIALEYIRNGHTAKGRLRGASCSVRMSALLKATFQQRTMAETSRLRLYSDTDFRLYFRDWLA